MGYFVADYFLVYAVAVACLWGAEVKADHPYTHYQTIADPHPLIPFRESVDIEGKIIDGRYHDCNHWFSLDIPDYADPCYIDEEYIEGRMCDVAFFNDNGFLLKVEVDEIIPEARHIISRYHDVKDEVLDGMFFDALLPQMQADVPRLQLLHSQKLVLDNGEPAIFAVINLPGASSIVDRSTGLSFDSKRGYLIFFTNDRRLVNLSMQDIYSLMPRFAETAKLYLKERLLKHLLQIQQRFRSIPEKDST